MSVTWRFQSYSWLADPSRGCRLEVRQHGQVWRWARYDGGISYERGEAPTAAEAKAAAVRALEPE